MTLKFSLKTNTKINKPALSESNWVKDYAEDVAKAVDDIDLTTKRLPRLDENKIYDDPYVLNGGYTYDSSGNIVKAEFELIVKDSVWNLLSQSKKDSLLNIFKNENFEEVK